MIFIGNIGDDINNKLLMAIKHKWDIDAIKKLLKLVLMLI